MEWPRIVPREIGIYVLYVCYNSENKQQQQQQLLSRPLIINQVEILWLGWQNNLKFKINSCRLYVAALKHTN